MRPYILDILPKINQFTSRKDMETYILNKSWILVNEENDQKITYRFREINNELLISVDGNAKKGEWELLEDGNSIYISADEIARTFKYSFIDDTVLALKLDNNNSEFVLFFNESAESRFKDNTLTTIKNYLNDRVKINISRHLIDNDIFSQTFPTQWSESICISDTFTSGNYPKLEHELDVIKDKIQFLNTKSHAAEIFIAYCEKRSVSTEISKFNKPLLEHLNNQKFPIALIEKIFKEHRNKPVFLQEFKFFLQQQIS